MPLDLSRYPTRVHTNSSEQTPEGNEQVFVIIVRQACNTYCCKIFLREYPPVPDLDIAKENPWEYIFRWHIEFQIIITNVHFKAKRKFFIIFCAAKLLAHCTVATICADYIICTNYPSGSSMNFSPVDFHNLISQVGCTSRFSGLLEEKIIKIIPVDHEQCLVGPVT